jgi:hypothetical protein
MGEMADNIKSLRELVEENIGIGRVNPTTAGERQLARSMARESKISIMEKIENAMGGINPHLTSFYKP